MKRAPYTATLSDQLRERLRQSPPLATEFLKDAAQGAVNRIAADKQIAESLKAFHPGGASPRRQVDLRGSSGRVLYKLFIGWDHAEECWHVLIEGGLETSFENQIVQQGQN